MTFFQTQESNEEGILPPHSPLLSPWDPTMLCSPSELVTPLLRPKLRPWKVLHTHGLTELVDTISLIRLLAAGLNKYKNQ